MAKEIIKEAVKEVAEFGAHFVGGEVLRNILFKVGATISDEGIKALKANIFGWGETDETLTGDAFVIAYMELKVSIEDTVRIADILSEYPPAVRNKLTNIVGHSEQEIVQKIPTIKDGKEILIEIKTVANMRGARLIFLLSKMKDDEIKIFIKGIDAITTMGDRFKESFGFISKGLKKLDDSCLERAEKSRDEQKAKYEAQKAKYEAKKRRR